MRPTLAPDRAVLRLIAVLGLVTLIAVIDVITPHHVSLAVLESAPPLAAATFASWPATALVGVSAVVATIVIGVPAGIFGSGQHGVRLAAVTLVAVLAVELARRRADRESQLRRLALHDRLTGLANRALLHEELAALLAARHRPGSIAVLFVDLDGFKLINDSYGHAVGDRFLVTVARRLRSVTRVGDLLSRLAGDEFVLVCPNVAGPADLARLAQRVRDALRAPVQVAGRALPARASIGVAVDTAADDDPERLILAADRAMYAAKARGGDRHQLYDERLARRSRSQLEDLERLRQAIADDRLAIAFQPQVDLGTGRVAAAEALVRWRDPERGPVPATEVVQLAETGGLIHALGARVLSAACSHAVSWPDHVGVAVNVSVYQLDSDLARGVSEALAGCGLDPGRLTLEITESALVRDSAEAARALGQLHDAGVRLSVDDFGTGYSSLLRLKEVPVDEIKIDQRFTAGITRPGGDVNIVSAVIGMADGLGLHTVAEGVERADQEQVLRSLHCAAAQGFLYAEPVPGPAFPDWLAAHC